MVDLALNKEFSNTVVPLIKGVRMFASNMIILPDRLVILQPLVEKSKAYMIIKEAYNSPKFLYHYFNVGRASSAISKFKKTKSEISWISRDGQPFFRIQNPDEEEPMDTYIMKGGAREAALLMADEYKKIPGWKETNVQILQDEPDSMYIEAYEGLAEDLKNKKQCELVANGYRMLLSRPFLGDTKKTEWIGYRVIHEDPAEHGVMIVKFKQKEEIGNIYSFAAFMKVPK